jgi:hypothetical protein
MKKLALLSAVAALAVAVPATAKQPPNHPNDPNHPNHPDSNNCTPHNVAWIASGTLVTWSLTKDANGSVTGGTVVIKVTNANHHAAGANGTTMTLMKEVVGARVRFGLGVNTSSPAVGSRVKLIGDVTAETKKCGAFSGTITVERIVVHEAHSG